MVKENKVKFKSYSSIPWFRVIECLMSSFGLSQPGSDIEIDILAELVLYYKPRFLISQFPLLIFRHHFKFSNSNFT